MCWCAGSPTTTRSKAELPSACLRRRRLKVVSACLFLSQSGAPDFADCLHVALAGAAGQVPMWTFDERAAKLDGARLLVAV